MTKNHHGINKTYNADIVIADHLDTDQFVIWQGGDIVAKVNSAGRALIIAGASTLGLSVYDADAGHFIAGTIAQLTP